MALTMGDFTTLLLKEIHHCAQKFESWRVGNIIGWIVIPSGCEVYVRSYMLGGQYLSDVDLMVEAAMSYASEVQLEGNGRDAWVFDIDDTVLSHVSYYSENTLEPHLLTEHHGLVQRLIIWSAQEENVTFFSEKGYGIVVGMSVLIAQGQQMCTVTCAHVFFVVVVLWKQSFFI
ncbi:hypothetical protein L7F22_027128 [Adiantum nelumboides]|nr:hypothetical protein [Adiantum nelumboides]